MLCRLLFYSSVVVTVFSGVVTGAGSAVAGLGEWTSQGPNGAHVFALAIDPVSPSTVYAGVGALGSGRGGLYKTFDSGANWAAVDADLPPSIWVTALAIDPIDAATVYCGSSISGEVHKTVDGGLHWNLVLDGAGVGLAIDPSTPSTVYATGSGGVFKSTDGGEHWAVIGNGLGGSSAGALVVDPGDPSTLYVASEERIFKSTDGGGSWMAADSGLDVGRVEALAIDPDDPSILYAGGRGVYRSTGGGGHWSPVNEGLITIDEIPASVRALAIDPATPSTVYAGAILGTGGGVYKSTDGGGSWVKILDVLRAQALAVDPADPSTVYAGVAVFLEAVDHSDGLLKSTDFGQSWDVSNMGLSNTSILALAIDPAQTSTLLAGFDDGLARSADGGATWELSAYRDFRITTLAVDPRVPSTVYAAVESLPQFVLVKSTDGGLSWASTGLRDVRVRQVLIDPLDSQNLYAVTFDVLSDPSGDVYRSSDGGATWVMTSPGLPAGAVRILALDPSAPSTLYAGTGEGVYKTVDGGDSWAAASAGLDEPDVRALAVAPADPTTIYAGTADGIFKTTNGGSGWFPAGLADSSITALAIDPVDSVNVYAASLSTVFRSSDGGGEWASFNDGLENAQVRSLVVDPARPSTLHAATDNGVFDIDTSTACIADEDTLCLNGDRFRVEVEWRDFEGTLGAGRVVPLGPAASQDSGLFWFFDQDNWEMLIKVLDGCAINGRFWVFSAATTNVAYTLRVTDTESLETREYSNPLGTSAAAVTDTGAFETCP
ncbi:MAG: hypothetical protein GY719_30685 [bacterium]|nr:hypothetical protein [bacterium]